MTDKKFTDEEIIKALEYCNADRNECDKCIFQRECESNPFYSAVAEHALDLINRQKSEIERLKGSTIVNNIMESQRIKREAKAEAYKEFAEKLKQHKRKIKGFDLTEEFWDYAVLVEDIENTLIEMVSEII